MRSLSWFEPGVGASREEVDALERAIGFKLPHDFAEFVTRHAGSSNPDECEFDVVESNGSKRQGNFGLLMSLSGADSESVLSALSDLRDQIPVGLVPVIDTGSGDFVCLDFRSGAETSVVYFFHEKSGGTAIVPLAQTFTDFLDGLRTPTDSGDSVR